MKKPPGCLMLQGCQTNETPGNGGHPGGELPVCCRSERRCLSARASVQRTAVGPPGYLLSSTA